MIYFRIRKEFIEKGLSGNGFNEQINRILASLKKYGTKTNHMNLSIDFLTEHCSFYINKVSNLVPLRYYNEWYEYDYEIGNVQGLWKKNPVTSNGVFLF